MTDWPEIIRAHGPLVWRTAFRLLNRAEDADDCFQLTFLAAVRLTAREPVENWPGLLTRLATSRALELLRIRYHERGEPFVGEFSGTPNSLMEHVEATELAERLDAAIATLDPTQAEVFCLVCLQGYSNRDVAEQLKLSTDHVGMILYRARASIRKRLGLGDKPKENLS